MSEHARVLRLVEAVDPGARGRTRVGAWLGGHRAEVVAAVRSCDREGERGLGVLLATAAWAVAGLVPDPAWWAELADAGEAVAIADRSPGALVELLHLAATTFAGGGDRVRAEERWVRALAVARRDGVADQGRLLEGLGALYRDWGRLGKALDAYLGLVDVRRAAGDDAGTAAGLAEVGATMHAAGRFGSAVDYFDQADEVLGRSGAPPAEHARVLQWCGWARWERGDHGGARRRWSRALALLVDVDEVAADRVRALLAAEPGSEPDFPYLPNTSSSPSGGVG